MRDVFKTILYTIALTIIGLGILIGSLLIGQLTSFIIGGILISLITIKIYFDGDDDV